MSRLAADHFEPLLQRFGFCYQSDRLAELVACVMQHTRMHGGVVLAAMYLCWRLEQKATHGSPWPRTNQPPISEHIVTLAILVLAQKHISDSCHAHISWITVLEYWFELQQTPSLIDPERALKDLNDVERQFLHDLDYNLDIRLSTPQFGDFLAQLPSDALDILGVCTCNAVAHDISLPCPQWFPRPVHASTTPSSQGGPLSSHDTPTWPNYLQPESVFQYQPATQDIIYATPHPAKSMSSHPRVIVLPSGQQDSMVHREFEPLFYNPHNKRFQREYPVRHVLPQRQSRPGWSYY